MRQPGVSESPPRQTDMCENHSLRGICEDAFPQIRYNQDICPLHLKKTKLKEEDIPTIRCVFHPPINTASALLTILSLY
ncbi:MAG: hypothetical protein DRI57_11410 [Deltaproteobacteria bacterium]|nr:MAG: hypothetical protein DRI57_11410 [Deltaproteobacteria bacterium]